MKITIEFTGSESDDVSYKRFIYMDEQYLALENIRDFIRRKLKYEDPHPGEEKLLEELSLLLPEDRDI